MPRAFPAARSPEQKEAYRKRERAYHATNSPSWGPDACATVYAAAKPAAAVIIPPPSEMAGVRIADSHGN